MELQASVTRTSSEELDTGGYAGAGERLMMPDGNRSQSYCDGCFSVAFGHVFLGFTSKEVHKYCHGLLNVD